MAAMLSPGGGRGRLGVLIYHRVLEEADPLDPDIPDAATFDWQMGLLAEEFRPLPLAEGVAGLARGTLPPRAVAVTFDDGYADNYTVALPILRRWGVPATFFIATGYLGGGRMWNDIITETVRRWPEGEMDLRHMGLGRWPLDGEEARREARMGLIQELRYRPLEERERVVEGLGAELGGPPSPRLMLDPGEVRALAGAGMEIGAHTRSHPILSTLDPDRARAEVAESKAHLEEITGGACRFFAYPNGRPGEDYGPEHVDLVRAAGFQAAVSTAWGAAGRETSRFQIPRFTPWNGTPRGFYLGLLRNLLRGRGPRAGDTRETLAEHA
ncbi:polysaccharide deacetylase [Thiohalorhabdus denitrificans]|uniref:Peptidoglycan/xylan/chitin deacetylase, PgdA/CDA1 family n=2 Tax=Thiohalorhabdus denitrificans TaxID=381306 RepID=A0A0P9CBL2_9GAMM|nr:polysaccharide deacetylase family protein [Thiohalorhabdus denitrificans]KPV40329.1 polysaccharide deacetylase [Thiohalorhabdus denitrificans]SCY12695.1 Peptidoglycan/xylan/chitin deacetylase, PgdA/CDA1 family [Thiohalorhabdus denitrificans]